MNISSWHLFGLAALALFFFMIFIGSFAKNKHDYPKIDDGLAQAFYDKEGYGQYRRAQKDNATGCMILIVGIPIAFFVFLLTAAGGNVSGIGAVLQNILGGMR